MPCADDDVHALRRQAAPSGGHQPIGSRRPALSWRGGAVLPAGRRRDRGVRDVPRAPARRDAEGPDRLRQDPLRRAHGLASRPAARHRRLPRRSLGQRSHRPLPDSRRRHGVARRPAHAGGAARRDLLSRRDHRGAHRHRRRHPSADRRSAHPAARQDRRARSRRDPAFSSSSPTTRATSTGSRT